jgi:hypothetical protein
MALIYNAQLTPSKIALLAAWSPGQPWWRGDSGSLEAVGAYRFDDPAGEVGIETHLLRNGDGQTLQVPLTYRGAPLDGADAALLGTMEHSVLGRRWVYDACFDPIYAAALATTILTGATEAELQIVVDNGLEHRPATTCVRGSGTPGTSVPTIDAVTAASDDTSTVIRAGGLQLLVRRVLTSDPVTDGAPTLTGVWPGSADPTVLAHVVT